jgi:hypothetical protein
MKKTVLFVLALLMLAGCGAKEQPVETTAIPMTTEAILATQAPTEPMPAEPPEPTLPSFEECRVLSYYFTDPIPYQYYTRWGEIEVIEKTKVHVRVYDSPKYKGDAVRQLAPGDILILGNREITVEKVETDDTYGEISPAYVINGGEGRDGVVLRPVSVYDTEIKKTVIDYYPKNSMLWPHLVLVDEFDKKLSNTMYLYNHRVSNDEMNPETFIASLDGNTVSHAPHGLMLDMVDGKLECIYIQNGIDSQTDLSMIPPGLEPISPERLHFLMTGEES